MALWIINKKMHVFDFTPLHVAYHALQFLCFWGLICALILSLSFDIN